MTNLNHFLGVESHPQKITRILVYPNITFSKNLEQDSYVQVLRNMVGELSKIRDDLFWYILSPEIIPSLAKFNNTIQIPWKLPTYPPAMRSHFDVDRFTEICGNHIDIDLVMSHLPEHTHQVVNTLYNVTHHKPKVFGYVHWFDFDDVMVWEKGSFNQNILGLLEMETCYINTLNQKYKVLGQMEGTFAWPTIDKVDKILTVQHLGVKEEEITSVNLDTPKIIVFNHRPDTYKHFPEFVTLIDRLWKKRQDFKVWVPLASSSTRPWMDTKRYPDKKSYLEALRNCRVGFSPKQTYGGWSVSTTDGLMNGVPYVMYDAPYYHELWPLADFFSTDDQALDLLEVYLDDRNRRNSRGVGAIKHIRQNLIYQNQIIKMSQKINELVTPEKQRDSEKVKELIEIIKKNKCMTKEELFAHCGWGRGIKWTAYRQALMAHPNIFDERGTIPKYIWREDNDIH